MSNPKGAPPTLQWNATLYDQQHAFVWQYGEDLVKLLAPQPGERILDLGCGTGHLTQQIAEAGARVIGIDSSPSMIEQARANFPAREFELADAEAFSFPEPFDAVFSNAALHWMKKADRVAECVSRALKTGGRFVAEFGGKGNVKEVLAAVQAALAAMGATQPQGVNPWFFPSVGEYSTLLEARGLSVVFASLFDRPTRLEDAREGMKQWLRMFGGDFLGKQPQEWQDQFCAHFEDAARPKLFRDGAWFVDYKRLRIVALKEAAS